MMIAKIYKGDKLIDEGNWMGSSHGSKLVPIPAVSIITGNDYETEREYVAKDGVCFEEYQDGVKVYDSKTQKDTTKHYRITNEQWEKKY